MSNYLFKQLRFARDNTLKQVSGMSGEKSFLIPPGFNNNVLWNLGHILLVHEKFSFRLINEKMEIPNHFVELFGAGTNPETWGKQVPDLNEIIHLLSNQIDRIEQKLVLRIDDEFPRPFVTSSGLELSTVKECLSFCLYHEGMHFASIKAIKLQM